MEDSESGPAPRGAGPSDDAPRAFVGHDDEGVEIGRPCASPELPAYELAALSLALVCARAGGPSPRYGAPARSPMRPERHA
jgi:hypothetical protein